MKKSISVIIILILMLLALFKISSLSAEMTPYCLGDLWCSNEGFWETHDCLEMDCNQSHELATCSVCIEPE